MSATPFEFKTRSARLGDLEVQFSGRAVITGQGSLEGDTVPDDADLPKGAGRAQRVQAWGSKRVRDQVKDALGAATPTGTATDISLDFLGQPLTLQLSRGFAGLPPFVVTAKLTARGDLRAGTARISRAALSVDVTATITPQPSRPGAAASPSPDDAAIKRFALGGGAAARFLDLNTDKQSYDKNTGRTGALALLKSLQDIDKQLPDVVKKSWPLGTPEKKVAFLQHMRWYFGTDARTIAHFSKLRQVELKKGVKSSLILHDEAATRLEAVRDELPAGSVMPVTDVGWPRGHPKLHGKANIANLHDLGLAIDFNATETPNLSDARLRDLIVTVTGGSAHLKANAWWHTTGDYDTMIARTEQRGKVADPDTTSKLGQLLDTLGKEAEAVSKRSQEFRRSVDSAVLLGLRKKRVAKTWTDAEDKLLAKTIEPWTKAVDKELTANAATVTKAGFDLATLKSGDALDAEKAAVQKAATAIAALRKGIKGDTLTERQRAAADKLLADTPAIIGAAAAAPTDDAARVKALGDLHAALGDLVGAVPKRLGGYGAARWRARARHLRSSLGDADWVLGEHKPRVLDPSPTQMAERGFFTLREHSTSYGGKAQPGAFDIPFMKAMVKHGFQPLAASDPPDSMHFELRWSGPWASRGTPPPA